jgi:hypothetical protein
VLQVNEDTGQISWLGGRESAALPFRRFRQLALGSELIPILKLSAARAFPFFVPIAANC